MNINVCNVVLNVCNVKVSNDVKTNSFVTTTRRKHLCKYDNMKSFNKRGI